MEYFAKLTCVFMLISLTYGASDYHDRYISWENEYKNRNVKPQYYKQGLENAISKSNQFEKYSQAERDAVKIVYLYTIDNDYYKIYGDLNAALRTRKIETFFSAFADLLNDAIVMLREKEMQPKEETLLFRGITRCGPIPLNGSYTFLDFLSTSTDPAVSYKFATDFGDCKEPIFIVFNRAVSHGLAVKNYSKVPREKEVLLSTGVKVQVLLNLNATANSTLKNTIRQQTQNIPGFPSDKTVSVFLHVCAGGQSRGKRSIENLCLSDISSAKKLATDCTGIYAITGSLALSVIYMLGW